MEPTESTAAQFFSPRQICFAAFVGSPVAACWCFARNFRQLGRPEVAQKWLIWGSGGSFVALAGLCLLPFVQRIPPYIILLAYSIAFREVAQLIQGGAMARHISSGGRLASWWYVVGISLLFLIGVIGLLLVVLWPFL